MIANLVQSPKSKVQSPTVAEFRLPGVRGPLGKIVWRAAFTPNGLRELQIVPQASRLHPAGDDPRLMRLMATLTARLNGENADLAWDEFDLTGAAEFHVRIWKALRQIPFGEVKTYAEVAGDVGSPLAFRACGQACGANRVMVFIPCHRVVAANGGLGGFGGGLEVKKLLLASEGNIRTER